MSNDLGALKVRYEEVKPGAAYAGMTVVTEQPAVYTMESLHYSDYSVVGDAKVDYAAVAESAKEKLKFNCEGETAKLKAEYLKEMAKLKKEFKGLQLKREKLQKAMAGLNEKQGIEDKIEFIKNSMVGLSIVEQLATIQKLKLLEAQLADINSLGYPSVELEKEMKKLNTEMANLEKKVNDLKEKYKLKMVAVCKG